MVFVDPTLGDLFQRRGVEIVKFVPAMPKRYDKVGPVQQCEMFGGGLPGHIEVLT